MDNIHRKILIIREERVMLDRELVELYGVDTRALNQAVKRNIKRFPAQFMFQLNDLEKSELITNCDRFNSLKYSTVNPYAFTEHGALMVSTVLNSEEAIKMSVFIIQAFVKFREVLSSHAEIVKRLDDLEKRAGSHDDAIRQIVVTIKHLMTPGELPKKKIGF